MQFCKRKNLAVFQQKTASVFEAVSGIAII